MTLSELKPGAPKNFRREREEGLAQGMAKQPEEGIKGRTRVQAAV